MLLEALKADRVILSIDLEVQEMRQVPNDYRDSAVD